MDVADKRSLKSKLKAIIDRPLVSWSAQLAIFAAIFSLLSWYQQKEMLNTNQPLAITAIKLADMNGERFEVDFNDHQQDTLVYFFAPWCSVCHASIDNLEHIYQRNPNNLNIVAIALDWDSKQQVESFLVQHQLSFPILLGSRQTAEQFKVSGYPSYYLISRFNQVMSKSRGYSTEIGLMARIKLNQSDE